jgi:hypothetical protein
VESKPVPDQLPPGHHDRVESFRIEGSGREFQPRGTGNRSFGWGRHFDLISIGHISRRDLERGRRANDLQKLKPGMDDEADPQGHGSFRPIYVISDTIGRT